MSEGKKDDSLGTLESEVRKDANYPDLRWKQVLVKSEWGKRVIQISRYPEKKELSKIVKETSFGEKVKKMPGAALVIGSDHDARAKKKTKRRRRRKKRKRK